MTSKKQPIERVGGGRFAKGYSGNPGGRAATPAHVKEMLGKLTSRAVEIMAETMEGEDPKLRFLAAQEVLNRAVGKPTQAIDVKGDGSMAGAQLAALTAMAAAAIRPPDEMPVIDVTPHRAETPALPSVATAPASAPSLADLAAMAPDSPEEER
jgi:hypothetical protein